MNSIGYVATLDRLRIEIAALRNDVQRITPTENNVDEKLRHISNHLSAVETRMEKIEAQYYEMREDDCEEIV